MVLDVYMDDDDIYFLVISSKTARLGVFSESVSDFGNRDISLYTVIICGKFGVFHGQKYPLY